MYTILPDGTIASVSTLTEKVNPTLSQAGSSLREVVNSYKK